MGKIFYLMGKSSSGKDTIYRELLRADAGKGFLKAIVSYTTRPIREGEREGREYYFVGEEEFQRLHKLGKVIEHREYHTCHGIWRYFMVDDGQVVPEEKRNYLMIGTLEGYTSLKQYFGENQVVPILIELDDGDRLQRALNRERKQQNPKYQEMCRRFLADSEDFAEEKIQAAEIDKRFRNEDLKKCLAEIMDYILSMG
ncbi:MAG: guanylate kinase [Lachnospiraceae bacterium]|nr:guanylate kinase [Lachnospiraceae bacterium]